MLDIPTPTPFIGFHLLSFSTLLTRAECISYYINIHFSS
jgi:hypothetical protein